MGCGDSSGSGARGRPLEARIELVRKTTKVSGDRKIDEACFSFDPADLPGVALFVTMQVDFRE